VVRPHVPGGRTSERWRVASHQWRVLVRRRSSDFVRHWYPDPAVLPTLGLQVTHRRSGRTAVAEDGRVRRPCPNQPGGASPRSPRWDNPIPSLVPHTGKGASVVRGLVSTRRSLEKLGMIAPFWPGVCATNLYDLPADSGLGCKGPERIFDGAGALKPWKASSATNETRINVALPSFPLRHAKPLTTGF